MSDENKKSVQKVKKGGGKKFLLIFFLALPLVIVVALFGLFAYVTSDGFFQSSVVPEISKQLGGEVKVSRSTIKPMSQFALDELSVRSNSKPGLEPVFEVRKIDLQYDLLKLLTGGGELIVTKVLVDTPRIHLKTYADHTTNFAFKTAESETESPKDPASGESAQVQISNVDVKNAYILVETERPDGTWDQQKIEGLNFSIDQLGNGKKGTIRLDVNTISNQSGLDKVVAALKGQLELDLSTSLAPEKVSGSMTLSVNEALGSFADLASVGVVLDLVLQPQSLDNLSLKVTKQGQDMGLIKASGPFDATKGEADVTLSGEQINRSVLNLLTVGSGMDFGRSSFSLNGHLKAARNWAEQTIALRIDGRSLEVISDGKSTPLTDLVIGLKADVNSTSSNAIISEFNILASQNGAETIKAGLDNTLTVHFGGAQPTLSDAILSMVIKGLDLNAWTAAMTPESPTSGVVNSTLNLTSRNNGQSITMDLVTAVNGFSNEDLSSPLHNSQINLNANGSVTGLKAIDLPKLALGISRAAGPLLTASGSLKFDEKGQLNFQESVQLFDAGASGDSEVLQLSGDASITPQSIDIKGIQLSLKPTREVTQNQVTVSGKLPGAENPAMAGTISIKSDGLDVTRLMAFSNSLAPKKEKDKNAPKDPSQPEVEPAPITLPYENLTTTVSIARFVADKLKLDEIQITKSLDHGKISLNPISFKMLGFPIRSDAFVDVSTTGGYVYNANLDFSDLPLSKLMSSMGEAVEHTKHAGLLDLKLGLNGKGFTSINIKNNFRALTKFNMEGGNMAISGGFKRFVIMPIAAVLRLDPILDGVVDRINMDAEFGQGILKVKDLLVGTEPFIIATSGNIGVSDNIGNTQFRLPLTMSLKREIAQSANFLRSDIPETQEYVPLPDFITLAGNFSGAPGVELDKTKIAQMLLQSAAGLPGETLNNAVEIIQDPVGTVGNVLNNVGGLIPGIGNRPGSTNALPRDPAKILKGLFDR